MKTEIMMKKIIVIASILATCSMAGTLKDSRDGQTYKTVKIGDQTWMAENLNYKTSGSACYDSKESNCEKYGRLYTWESAKKACPAGWRLPSVEEFKGLLDIAEGASYKIRSINLRARSWENGSDKFGFSALPAGDYDGRDKKFYDVGDYAVFWSSTESGGNNAYDLELNDDRAYFNNFDKNSASSVRCLQDSNEGGEASSQRSEAQPPSGTLKDSRDGKTYKTVKIGKQTWMAENLNYETKGSMCHDYKESNCEKYGRLYTRKAAWNACPSGWHLPSKEEFERLLDIAGGDSYAIRSINLRARSWGKGSDKFGFSALPAGSYDSYRKRFNLLGDDALFWSSTDSYGYSAYYLYICSPSASVSDYDKTNGYSVRCLQDSNEGGEASSQRSEAQPPSGTLKDSRDGKTYKTVKIGEQVWMAENLNYKTDDGSTCYDSEESNCEKYGRLYTWESAKKACPAGWRLPSVAEFKGLLDIAEGEIRSLNLRARSWENGSDKFGFSALPAGTGGNEEFYDVGNYAYFWSSTEYEGYYAYRLRISGDYAGVRYDVKRSGLSVRCLQD